MLYKIGALLMITILISSCGTKVVDTPPLEAPVNETLQTETQELGDDVPEAQEELAEEDEIEDEILKEFENSLIELIESED